MPSKEDSSRLIYRTPSKWHCGAADDGKVLLVLEYSLPGEPKPKMSAFRIFPEAARELSAALLSMASAAEEEVRKPGHGRSKQ